MPGEHNAEVDEKGLFLVLEWGDMSEELAFIASPMDLEEAKNLAKEGEPGTTRYVIPVLYSVHQD